MTTTPPPRYEAGGWLPPGPAAYRAAAHRPERVLTEQQWRTITEGGTP